jgi:cell division septation protein DedD
MIRRFSDHDIQRRLIVLVALTGLLLVIAGCGGGDKEEQSTAQRSGGLVPAKLDSVSAVAGVDTAAVPAAGEQMTEPVGDPSEDAQAPKPVVEEIRAQPSKTAPAKVPAAKKAAPGGAFSLQVGSFRQESNAVNLALKIRERGYQPVVEVAEVGGMAYHRVFIRGLADRTQAENIGEELRSGLGINYLVLRSN